MNIITSNKNQNKWEINVLELNLESLNLRRRYLISLQAGPTEAKICFNDTQELNNFINALTDLRDAAVTNAEWERR